MRVLFTSQPSSGHWHPLVPLAQALEAAGHEAAFASTPGFCPGIEAKGFRAFRAGADDSEEEVRQRIAIRDTRSSSDHADYMMAHVFARLRAERSLPDLLDIAREWQPDVVVGENTEFSGCVMAEHAGIPHASVQITAPRTTYLQIIDESLHHLRSSVGLPPCKPADMLYRYLLLSSRPPSLWNPEFPVPRTAHSFRYSGFNQSGQEALPEWVPELEGRPTVYATLGTMTNHMTGVLSAILEGLRDEPVNLVLTVGRNRDPQEFGEQPANVHIERYIPQNLLLPFCDLVVTHGGSGTMLDALSLGIPMVMIPIIADQPLNAHLCAQAGAARVIEQDGRTATAIRDAALAVLHDPGYRQAAQRIQREIEALPGLEYLVGLLERLASERTALM